MTYKTYIIIALAIITLLALALVFFSLRTGIRVVAEQTAQNTANIHQIVNFINANIKQATTTP